MKFAEVAETFEEMTKTTKRLELSTLLSDLLKRSGEDLKIICYLLQGKLLPDYYGIETGMSDKLILEAFSKEYGKPRTVLDKQFGKLGDLGSLAEALGSRRVQSGLFSSDLTVSDVYSTLMEIARTEGKGSISQRIGLFERLIRNSTPIEAKYITRILTGKLRLGVSDSTILKAMTEAFATSDLGEQIEVAFNFHPDMGRLAEILRDGKLEQIRAAAPDLMIPAKVMLAERLPSLDQILEKMGGRAAFEYKYDGMRVQIHKEGEKVRIFSRGSEETTANFPDIVDAAIRTFQGRDLIVDGEAVPFNPETGEMYPFQAVSQRRGRIYNLDEMSRDIPLTVFLFDILYLDGKPTVMESYPERRKLLASTLVENDQFKLATVLVSSELGEIEAFFEKAISEGCEGIVAKNVSDASTYRAGARGWLWIKFKRDYRRELGDSLDLVVIGAFNGHGRRKGTFGALLLASYDQDQDLFESVCKLGTGFKDDVLFNLPKMMESYVEKEKPSRVTSGIMPDIWIYPSIVLEVVGAEITLSPVHNCAFGKLSPGAGLALRFPRFTGRFRDDKKPEDATSTSEIVEMYQNQKKTLERAQ